MLNADIQIINKQKGNLSRQTETINKNHKLNSRTRNTIPEIKKKKSLDGLNVSERGEHQ